LNQNKQKKKKGGDVGLSVGQRKKYWRGYLGRVCLEETLRNMAGEVACRDK
jgi:hypothetical protein